MFATVVDSRPRTRPRAEHRFGLRSEVLESRRLLDAAQPIVSPNLSAMSGLPALSLELGTNLTVIESSPIDVASNPAFATGLPVTGLEPGTSLATPAGSTLPTFQASVSLPPITSSFPPLSGPSTGPSSFGPSATGPSTTLNPLGNDTETAIAPAAEVAVPTPGRSDRISSIVSTPPIIPLPHLRSPELDVVPERRAQPRPPAKAPALPVQPPVKPATPTPEPAVPKAAEPEIAPPARPIDAGEPTVPKAAPTEPKAAPAEPKEPMSFQVWDTAIDLIATGDSEDSPALMTDRMEGAMAFAALLAAWGGWKYGARPEGRSRRRPYSLSGLEAGPGDGTGR